MKAPEPLKAPEPVGLRPPVSPLPPPGRPPPLSPKKRPAALIGVAAAVVATLAAGTLVSRRLFEGSPRPARPMRSARPPSAGPVIQPAPTSTPFRVATTSGRVEAFRGVGWVDVRTGDVLTLQDVVRTGPGARAVLRRGPSVELELREKVEVRLDRVTSDATSLDVRRGKVVANVVRPDESLAITARQTRSVNDGVARFVVSVDQRGRVAVASTGGTTRFSAQGKEVRVTQGTESHAEPGQAPADPERIAEEVLLSVVWPPGNNRLEKTQIRGQAPPDSLVKVNGVEAEVEPDGRFSVVIPLREGENQVEVKAEDLAGRTRSVTGMVKRYSKSPSLEAEQEELWRQP